MDGKLPDFVTHYYVDRPFRTLTELTADECRSAIQEIGKHRKVPRRLQSAFYFEQRHRYERLMREQFLAKGGRPHRAVPHYAVLGESEIWASICPSAICLPLAELPDHSISFTYTDSYTTYVDRDLDGHFIPRKPQYGTLYLRSELTSLIARYGWPGDRWKTEEAWAHDLYIEVQIWDDAPLRSALASRGIAY